MVEAAESAVQAGVVGVLARETAARRGTGNLPSLAKVISVGAVSKNAAIFFASVNVTAPTPVPAGATT